MAVRTDIPSVPRRAATIAPPRVLYFSRIDLPSDRANSIQTLNTCLEMAQQGAEVLLVVQRLAAPRRHVFAHYGLPEHPRLRMLSLSLPLPGDFNAWRGRPFRLVLGALLRRQAQGPTLLVTRDPAGLELLQQVARLRPTPAVVTLFEVHKLAFLTKASHQEERGRSLDDPAVRAKVEARRKLEADVYAAVDGIVCTSANAQHLLEEHFPRHAPVCVVPNGTRIPHDAAGAPRVAARLDDTGRDLDLLYVGQLYRWKGVDGLVRALGALPGRRLTIVGGNDPGDVARLRALAAEHGVLDRLEFAGHVPPAAVEGYLARARVGVIPLPQHGFVEATHFTSPLKAFELMRAGVPIVATDLPSMREILRHDEHAILVPPDDPHALAQGIDLLLRDRPRAARLVEAAARHVVAYSWAARARRILAFGAALHGAPLGRR